MFTVDGRYVRPLAVALESLRRCCSQPRPVVVVHNGLGRRHRQRLARWLASSNLQLQFLRLHAPLAGKRLAHHFTAASLLRLVMVEQLPFNTLIYVDADVIFCRDPAVLDAVDLEGVSLAAAAWLRPRDLWSEGFGVLDSYFATGLLLVHRRNFLDARLGQRSLELLHTHNFEFPDQDALNLCRPQWRPLPPGWSVEVDPQGSGLGGFPHGAVVLQLAGADKPWHLLSAHPARALFSEHLAATPYRRARPGLADCRWRNLASRLRYGFEKWFRAAMAAAQARALGWRSSPSSRKR